MLVLLPAQLSISQQGVSFQLTALGRADPCPWSETWKSSLEGASEERAPKGTVATLGVPFPVLKAAL